MTKILNRVGMLVSTTGQGALSGLTVAISNRFLTPAEAGAVDGEQYFWLLEEGNDFEIFKGTWNDDNTLTRDEVIASKIGGVAGTTKLTLAGGATLRSALPREGVAQGWTLIETIVASSGNNKVFDNIPDAYHDLYVVGENLDVTSGVIDLLFEYSVDNGSNYGSNNQTIGQVSTAGDGICMLTILGSQLRWPIALAPFNVSSVAYLDLASANRINAIKVLLDPEQTGGTVTFTGSGTLKLYGR